MLLLLFKIGEEHFAMAANQVREVVPCVALTRIPSAPEFAAGLMNYRTTLVPVVDLCRLATGKPSALKMSTRIILVDYTLADDRPQILGLLAEHMVETVTSKQPLFPPAAVKFDDLHDCPTTLMQSNDVIQLFDLHRMLPTQEINTLFTHLRKAKKSAQPELNQV